MSKRSKISLSDYPALIREWHPTKNGKVIPDNIHPGSHKKFWWRCENGHSYQYIVRDKVNRKKTCSACNSLAFCAPNIAKEWHPTKNGDKKPEHYAHKSGVAVWWQCPKNEQHVYNSVIWSRTGIKTGCPFCAGKRVCGDNNLRHLYPDLSKEWHPTKNGDKKPEHFTAGTHKKAWWQCPANPAHEFYSRIVNRATHGHGCPYCSGVLVCSDNNIVARFPEVAKEWHPTKNGRHRPEGFTFGSGRIFWWLCPRGHSYKAQICNRTAKNSPTGCPYCAGQKIDETNNLKARYPRVALEWHPTKNGNLRPEEVMPGSPKKVWWLCPKGHSYEATLGSRALLGTGCSKCNPQSSKSEKRLFFELVSVFASAQSGAKIDGVELDVYLPDINVGIEFDGTFYHKGKKRKQDLNKNLYMKNKKIRLIRVREHPLPKIGGDDIIIKKPYTIEKAHVNSLFEVLLNYVNGSEITNKIKRYIKLKNFQNEDGFEQYVAHHLFPKKPLSETHSLLCKEWDYELNGTIKPENFTSGSGKKVWWKCKKSKKHTYLAPIHDRTGNKIRGCPYCAGKRVCDDNSLAAKFPTLSREWHPTKNYGKSPHDYTSGSSKKVWWKCERGHEFSATICNRTNEKQPTGCPYCSGHKIGKDNNLGVKFPLIAAEWHPTKNNDTTPYMVPPAAPVKYWWLCPQKHSYQATIGNRTNEKQPTGCPYCANRKVGRDNSLLFKFPKIAQLWHPSKNKNLGPGNVVPGSYSNVWWKCRKGHVFNVVVNDMVKRGGKCLYCTDKLVSRDNNLSFKFPHLGREWHTTKNKEGNPGKIIASKNIKGWWKCPKGHEYEAQLQSRINGKHAGCLYCSGQLPTKIDNLLSLFPDIASQWDHAKNEDSPDKFSPKNWSTVWWRCPRNHSYEAPIFLRVYENKNCPYCSNKRIGVDNNLAYKFPLIAKQWDREKNNGLSPEKIGPGSHKKVWWKCPKGHSFQRKVYKHVNSVRGCNICYRDRNK